MVECALDAHWLSARGSDLSLSRGAQLLVRVARCTDTHNALPRHEIGTGKSTDRLRQPRMSSRLHAGPSNSEYPITMNT
jgi:hypothetical protein